MIALTISLWAFLSLIVALGAMGFILLNEIERMADNQINFTSFDPNRKPFAWRRYFNFLTGFRANQRSNSSAAQILRQ
jgi:hypothetical protein